ncbi:hypothetical protein B9Z55_023497 [Caenorhabditis nigoni]|uniref:F-box domain-containing protein n=1 Tax=Caenorhabditis nigoni TaxID=1611254 RepID=A0A2G5SQM8_9PELO|nr:hypothetical protein B9Z55_023497 [Caenorhabditis nigoni]
MSNSDAVKKLKVLRILVQRIVLRYQRLRLRDEFSKAGHLSPATTAAVVKAVQEMIRQRPETSTRKMVNDVCIFHRLVETIANQKLYLYYYQMQKTAFLTEKYQLFRKKEAQHLLRGTLAIFKLFLHFLMMKYLLLRLTKTISTIDFTTFDHSSDAYKMNVTAFFFRRRHMVCTVEEAFKMLKRDFSTITIGEVQNAFLELEQGRIPVPINNRHLRTMDFTTFDPSSDAYKMNCIAFFFRIGHSVEEAFRMLFLGGMRPNIRIGEVRNGFLALKPGRIPVPDDYIVNRRACWSGIDAPIKDKILRMLPGKDLKEIRRVSRDLYHFINGMDLVINKVKIHMKPSSMQLTISKLGMTDRINVKETKRGCVVGVKEFENFVERRNKKVEELHIEFGYDEEEEESDEEDDGNDREEKENNDEEDDYDLQDDFFTRMGETLARLEPRLMCNALNIEARCPLDLLPIFRNLSSENFEKLTITSAGRDVFDMKDVVGLPQWRELKHSNFTVLSTLSLANISHIPWAVISTRYLESVESVVAFVENCIDSPIKLFYLVFGTIDNTAVARRLRGEGRRQNADGGRIQGRIPLIAGEHLEYDLRDDRTWHVYNTFLPEH